MDTTVVNYTPPQRIINDSIQGLSSVYYAIIVHNVPMKVIISNVNTTVNSSALFPFFYNIAADGDLTFRHLSNGVFVKLDADGPENWSTQESVPSVVGDVLVFPNPYVSRGTNVLSFRLPPVADPYATLSVFSSALDKIISKEIPVVELKPSEPSVTWDGRDERGDLAPSGVYFYVITVDNKEHMGKFALIRE
jgi:hypothetical protein